MNSSNRSFISHAKDLISCSNTHTIEELSEMSNLWINDRFHYQNNIRMENNMGSGYFMSTIVRELYSIILNSNKNNQKVNDLIKNSMYKNEIYLFNKICYVFDVNKINLLFTPNRDDLARNYMREYCFYLTKDSTYWDKLERQLDLFFRNRNIQETRELYLNNIRKLLLSAMDYAFINGQKDNKDMRIFSKSLIKKAKKATN